MCIHFCMFKKLYHEYSGLELLVRVSVCMRVCVDMHTCTKTQCLWLWCKSHQYPDYSIQQCAFEPVVCITSRRGRMTYLLGQSRPVSLPTTWLYSEVMQFALFRPRTFLAGCQRLRLRIKKKKGKIEELRSLHNLCCEVHLNRFWLDAVA